MEYHSLVGRTLESVMIYPMGEVHAAWVDEDTLPINTWCVFLFFAGSETIQIEACEIKIPDQYPALGLSINEFTNASTTCKGMSGKSIEAVSVKESEAILPGMVTKVTESDPLGEDVTTQYTLEIDESSEIWIRHTMPPMMIGLFISDELSHDNS